ncbi:MAG: glycosyltransferase [Planctomycetota bacterium]|nr:glycosyltransferase [Planctomycetota bacterium]
MKIVQIITRRELRGAEVVAADLCRSLTQRGHEVSLIGLFDPPNQDDADTLSRDLPLVLDLGGPKRRGFRWDIFSKLRNHLKALNPDVVQANAFNALKFTALSRITTRATWPLVYRNVGLASQWVTRPGQKLWGRQLLKQVAKVISVSAASRRDFSTTYQIPKADIAVLNQGVVIPRPFPKATWRNRLTQLVDRPDASFLLVHVGNFSPEKNHLGLLQAFGVVVSSHPAAQLVLLGDGPMRQQVAAEATHLGLAANVHLPGAQAAAADLAGGADAMLISSHVEGIPGVLLEAYARNVPAISTDVGGIHEVIQNGHNGILVPPGDMLALGRETVALLEDHTRRHQLGEAAHRRVVETHDMETSVDQLEALYHELVTSARGVSPATAFHPVALQKQD